MKHLLFDLIDCPPDLLDELNDAIETLDAIREEAGGRLPKEEGPEVKKLLLS